MERTFRQKMNRGYSDGMSRAFEVALVPVVFGGLGWLVDSALGTKPAFLLAFVIFAVVGMFLRIWIRYNNEMAQEEAGKVWNRSSASTRPGVGEAS